MATINSLVKDLLKEGEDFGTRLGYALLFENIPHGRNLSLMWVIFVNLYTFMLKREGEGHMCLLCHLATLQILLLYARLKVVFSRCEDVARDQNTRDQLAWAAENGDPIYEVCIPHRVHRAREQQR